ncbi:efflux RND transporter periplasmic adaptor subunit [Candidatus Cetobacterium colombiensis]|uniref:Efflux RND transporter periplasmic adaptor subunit n=1 Tax=Candidatus Cetobacterium colombiensis TaxID=3073100 RepID=A0ABU4W9J5_9FUSO|nr:efflux RND transporter periplasmic adaptor subunit [Candidatus Cetobacterium colombiensis]MDX8336207.1 efflux RND transporter periplasmic adaptor subunit [Candidatus Cetobacterium colombiensis]
MIKKIFAIVLSLVLLGCGSEKNKQKPKEKIGKNIKIQDVSPELITKLNISSGITEPLNEVKVVTKTGGTVKQINFKNGDKVQKGQIILTLEDQEVQSAYLKAQATYLSNKADFDIKRKNYEKFRQLYDKSLISEDEYLAKKTGYLQGESDLKSSEAMYLSAKKDFEDLVVKSKLNGIVTDLNLKLYEKVAPNSDIVTVVDSSKILVKTGVSVHEISELSVGNKAKIDLEGIEKNYFGNVYEINPVANKDNKKYQIKVEIDNPEGKIKKGMYSKVLVETGRKDGYLVPKNTIVIKDLYSYIFVVENGEARKIKVDRGYSNGDRQEIISDELYSNMQLVTEGQFLLEDRDKVNIIN